MGLDPAARKRLIGVRQARICEEITRTCELLVRLVDDPTDRALEREIRELLGHVGRDVNDLDDERLQLAFGEDGLLAKARASIAAHERKN